VEVKLLHMQEESRLRCPVVSVPGSAPWLTSVENTSTTLARPPTCRRLPLCLHPSTNSIAYARMIRRLETGTAFDGFV
jgi:hypothetical protein